MLKKTASLLFAFFLQTACASVINIHGTVTDSITKKPVRYAVVRLAGAGLADTTDTNGVFVLSGNVGILVPFNPSIHRSPRSLPQENGFIFSFSKPQQVSVTIFNSIGKAVISRVVDVGVGSFRLDPPELTDGIYLYKIKTAEGTYCHKFLCSGRNVHSPHLSRQAGPSSGVLAKILADTTFSDTIAVRAFGYYMKTRPSSDPQETGVSILLSRNQDLSAWYDSSDFSTMFTADKNKSIYDFYYYYLGTTATTYASIGIDSIPINSDQTFSMVNSSIKMSFIGSFLSDSTMSAEINYIWYDTSGSLGRTALSKRKIHAVRVNLDSLYKLW